MNNVVNLKYVQSRRTNSYLSPSIRVSVGDVHLPFLTLVKVDDNCFFCTHEKRALPEPRKLLGNAGKQHNGMLNFVRIPLEKWDIILEAIKIHENNSGYHLNPHTFLVAWCLAKGVDLYKDNLLQY